MIPVTKPYLPDREKLNRYIDGIYEREWLTNNGPLLQELTKRLENYLGVENLLLVSNGTLALQIAYRALGIHEPVAGVNAEAITTPFTFIATASSLKWEGITPVFADIDPNTLCLDPESIRSAITPNTRAIVPVHVYGNSCNVEKIAELAESNGLKVIYDAAHAFGVNFKGESLLKWGDAATLSFHATKVFHTIEGGAIVFKRKEDLEQAKLLINFGIQSPDVISSTGINAKMNEFQAAMGLCVLDDIELIISQRKKIIERYNAVFNDLEGVHALESNTDTSGNGAYYPILFSTENQLKRVIEALKAEDIISRRYFFPSLDTLTTLDSLKDPSCSISRNIASRVLCLPLYHKLLDSDIDRIAEIIRRCVNEFYDTERA